MPQLIKSVFEFLLEKKKDIYALKLKPQDGIRFIFNEESEINKVLQKEILSWFKENNINVQQVYMDSGLLCGWDGMYYVDFENDDQVKAYAERFEDKTGKSLEPEKYQMFIFSYEEWINDERLKETMNKSLDTPF